MRITLTEAKAFRGAFGAGSATARRLSAQALQLAFGSSFDASALIDDLLDVEVRKGTYSVAMLSRVADVYSTVSDARKVAGVIWF